jgi:hypothetical protein
MNSCLNPSGWCFDCPHDEECNGGKKNERKRFSG